MTPKQPDMLLEGVLPWRQWLAVIVKDKVELKRIAEEVGVSPRTILRYTEPQSNIPKKRKPLLLAALPPTYRSTFEQMMREDATQAILEALPRPHRAQFAQFSHLIRQGATQVEAMSSSHESDEIASVFYKVAVNAKHMGGEPTPSQTVIFHCLRQLLSLLDQRQDGVALLLFVCQASEDGRVRILQQFLSVGSGKWRDIPLRATNFAGAESLAGQALRSRRIEHLQQPEQLQACGLQETRMLVAFPIQIDDRVAGVLVVCGEGPLPIFQQNLLLLYSQLLAVTAFREKDFYRPEQIVLTHCLPSSQFQAQLLLVARELLSHVRAEAERAGYSLTQQEAEEILIKGFQEYLTERASETSG